MIEYFEVLGIEYFEVLRIEYFDVLWINKDRKETVSL